ncbi:MAG: ABC transporter substrate-binding protein [Proteobacteria bacterium]|nr:ABC transporter substrate-binding protein [Pseudomonadota bacterium]
MQCYGDGNECEVTRELLAGFEKKHPNIRVVVDVVPYKAILENLPIQLAAGEGPDMARVTDLGGLNKYYLDLRPHLKDPAYWEKNFGKTLDWYRAGRDDRGIYGLMTQLTVTGPIVNKTLFDQAGVAMPARGATWDDWVAATHKVAKATEVPFPMAMDRSGHRFAGLAISMGAKYFDADGNPAVVDDGFRNMAKKFIDWHKDGTMPKEIWGGSGGGQYRDGMKEFQNAHIVMLITGSWQIERLDKNVGDAFDWVAVPNPCGPAGCSGIPGGAGLVVFKHTKHPKEAALVLDYLAREEVHAEYMVRTANIPAHAAITEKGLDYKLSLAAKTSLNTFMGEVSGILPPAYVLQGYPYNRAIYNATVSRLGQSVAGELSVDNALKRITADINEAVKEAQRK